MFNELVTVQKFFKVFRILAVVFTVLIFVGASISALVGALMLVLPSDIFEPIRQYLIDYDTTGILVTVFDNIALILLLCAFIAIANGVLGIFVAKYFKNELKAGTPFTYGGGKELLTLGILIMAVPLCVNIICASVLTALNILPDATELQMSIPVFTGVGIIALSFVFKYGAQVLNSLNHLQQNNITQE